MELLFTMSWTCALDVVDAYPDGIPSSVVGAIFGMTEQAVQGEILKPHVAEAMETLRSYAEKE